MSRLLESPEYPESPESRILVILGYPFQSFQSFQSFQAFQSFQSVFFYKKWLAISLNTRCRSLFSACGGRRTGSTGTSHQPPMGHWATGMNSQMRIILIDLVDHMMNHMISYAICNIFLRTVTRPFWSRAVFLNICFNDESVSF